MGMAESKTPRLGLSLYSSGTDLHPNRSKFNAEHQLMDLLLATARKGALAERPAPGDGLGIYWATDTKQLYFDDGVAWQQVNTTGGGGAGQPIVIGGNAEEGTSARAARADHTHALPLATSTTPGAMSSADKALLDGAGANAGPNRVFKADGSGNISVNSPTSPIHPARKDYVDNAIQTAVAPLKTRNPISLSSTTNLNDLQTTEDYTQNSSASATVANNYPIAARGLLQVLSPTSSSAVYQFYTSYGNDQVRPRTFFRAYYQFWSEWQELVATLATTTADGLMAAADKAKLDAASANNNSNALVRRDANGRILVARVYGSEQPSSNDSLTRRDYVDGEIAKRALASHKHDAADVNSGVLAYERIPNLSADASNTWLSILTNSGGMRISTEGKFYTVSDNGSGTMQTDFAIRSDGTPYVRGVAPVYANDLVRKDYVDRQDAKQVSLGGELASTNLNGLLTEGDYYSSGGANSSTANNYPIPNCVGTVSVRRFISNSSWVIQRVVSWAYRREWIRSTNDGGATWSAWEEQVNATRLADSTRFHGDALTIPAVANIRGTVTVNFPPGIFTATPVVTLEPYATTKANITDLYISRLSSTSFDITYEYTNTANRVVYWQAMKRG